MSNWGSLCSLSLAVALLSVTACSTDPGGTRQESSAPVSQQGSAGGADIIQVDDLSKMSTQDLRELSSQRGMTPDTAGLGWSKPLDAGTVATSFLMSTPIVLAFSDGVSLGRVLDSPEMRTLKTKASFRLIDPTTPVARSIESQVRQFHTSSLLGRRPEFVVTRVSNNKSGELLLEELGRVGVGATADTVSRVAVMIEQSLGGAAARAPSPTQATRKPSDNKESDDLSNFFEHAGTASAGCIIATNGAA